MVYELESAFVIISFQVKTKYFLQKKLEMS